MAEQPKVKRSLLEKSRKFRRDIKFGEKIESVYPYVFGLAIGAILYSLDFSRVETLAILNSTLSSSIAVAAILAGLQAAAQSTVLALIDAKVVNYLKRIGKYQLLIKYLWSAITCLTTFIVLAICIQAACGLADPSDGIPPVYLAAVGSIFMVSLLTVLRISHLVARIMIAEHRGDHQRPTFCEAGIRIKPESNA